MSTKEKTLAERIETTLRNYRAALDRTAEGHLDAARDRSTAEYDCACLIFSHGEAILAALSDAERREHELARLRADAERMRAGSATDALEKWVSAHKSHSARINHDDGYGASYGWEVELWLGAKGKLSVVESFCNNEFRDADPIDLTAEQELPGLDWTIRKALELASALAGDQQGGD